MRWSSDFHSSASVNSANVNRVWYQCWWLIIDSILCVQYESCLVAVSSAALGLGTVPCSLQHTRQPEHKDMLSKQLWLTWFLCQHSWRGWEDLVLSKCYHCRNTPWKAWMASGCSLPVASSDIWERLLLSWRMGKLWLQPVWLWIHRQCSWWVCEEEHRSAPGSTEL